MRILRSMHATAAAIVLMALLAIAVCSGMAAPGMAQSMPSNCPLHPHHGQPVDQPASCCAASPRGEAVTESQVRLPDLAIIGNAPQLPVVQQVIFAAATTQPTAVEPPPPRLIALRI